MYKIISLFFISIIANLAVAQTTISNVSGTWFDRQTNGLGFNIVQTDREGLTGYFYGYTDNADGDPLWLITEVLTIDSIEKDATYSLAVSAGYSGNGGSFTSKPTDDTNGVRDWGTLNITFSSCTKATATLNGNDGVMSFDMIKLANLRNTKCSMSGEDVIDNGDTDEDNSNDSNEDDSSNSYGGNGIADNFFSRQTLKSGNIISDVSGTWFDRETNGLGFNLIQTDSGTGGLTGYFYGYSADADGDPLWLITELLNVENIEKDAIYTLEVFSGYTGNGGSFTEKPTDDTNGVRAWGSLDISFSSCTQATATLTGLDGVMDFNMIKLANLKDITCTSSLDGTNGSDNDGSDNDGSDNDGSDNDGSDNDGSGNDGSDNDSSDNDGSDTVSSIKPSLTIIGATNINETTEHAIFQATLSHAYNQDVTISVSTAGDSAKSGSDYEGFINKIVTIKSGQTSATIAVKIIDDQLWEGTATTTIGTDARFYDGKESFNLQINSVQGASYTGSNSFTITIQDHVDDKDYLTPQMFGAKADGSHDDTPATLQAMLYSPNVYFPSGTYQFVAGNHNSVVGHTNKFWGILPLYSGQNVWGDGNDSILTSVRQKENLSYHSRIKNTIFTFENHWNGATKYTQNVNISNLRFYNVFNAMSIAGVKNVVVSNIKIDHTAMDGLTIGRSMELVGLNFHKPSDVTIRNVEIHDVQRNGIAVYEGKTITIDNVNIHNLNPDPNVTDEFAKLHTGIDIEPVKNGNANDITISNSTFDVDVGNAIFLYTPANGESHTGRNTSYNASAYDITITNNNIVSHGGHNGIGIVLVEDVTIENNTYINKTIESGNYHRTTADKGPAPALVRTAGASDLIISNNQVSYAGLIYFEGTEKVVIKNNTMTSPSTNKEPLLIRADGYNGVKNKVISIIDNHLTDSGGTILKINTTEQVLVNGNTFAYRNNTEVLNHKAMDFLSINGMIVSTNKTDVLVKLETTMNFDEKNPSKNVAVVGNNFSNINSVIQTPTAVTSRLTQTDNSVNGSLSTTTVNKYKNLNIDDVKKYMQGTSINTLVK